MIPGGLAAFVDDFLNSCLSSHADGSLAVTSLICYGGNFFAESFSSLLFPQGVNVVLIHTGAHTSLVI